MSVLICVVLVCQCYHVSVTMSVSPYMCCHVGVSNVSVIVTVSPYLYCHIAVVSMSVSMCGESLLAVIIRSLL